MRLIILGDCLTDDKVTTWTSNLAKELDREYVNLSVSGSQNLLQIQIMQDWLLYNDLNKDDIIIWQIGFSWHPLLHLSEEYHDDINKVDIRTRRTIFVTHYHQRKENIIDKKKRYSLLHFSPLQCKFINRKKLKDEADVIQNFLFMCIIIKKLCPNLLILLGRDDFIKKENWEELKKIFLDKKIHFIEKGIVNWCEENNLELSKLIPRHPTNDALNIFKNEIIVPELIELNWISVNKKTIDT